MPVVGGGGGHTIEGGSWQGLQRMTTAIQFWDHIWERLCFLTSWVKCFRKEIKWTHHKTESFQATTKASQCIYLRVSASPRKTEPSSLQPSQTVCSQHSPFPLLTNTRFPKSEVRFEITLWVTNMPHTSQGPFFFSIMVITQALQGKGPLEALPFDMCYGRCRNKPVR